MPPNTTPADFDALVRRSGMPISPAEIADIYVGWGYVEKMLQRVRGNERDRPAEPAHVFRPEGT
jgi:hypothetical protein